VSRVVVQLVHVFAVLVVHTTFRAVVVHEAHDHVWSVEFLLRVDVPLEGGFLRVRVSAVQLHVIFGLTAASKLDSLGLGA